MSKKVVKASKEMVGKIKLQIGHDIPKGTMFEIMAGRRGPNGGPALEKYLSKKENKNFSEEKKDKVITDVTHALIMLCELCKNNNLNDRQLSKILGEVGYAEMRLSEGWECRHGKRWSATAAVAILRQQGHEERPGGEGCMAI
jgi:hypothetical protein